MSRADTLQEEIQKVLLGSPRLDIFEAGEAVYSSVKREGEHALAAEQTAHVITQDEVTKLVRRNDRVEAGLRDLASRLHPDDEVAYNLALATYQVGTRDKRAEAILWALETAMPLLSGRHQTNLSNYLVSEGIEL